MKMRPAVGRVAGSETPPEQRQYLYYYKIEFMKLNDLHLAEFTPVSIRTVWQNEQYHFTPWLAQPDNIRKLSAILGMELEVERVEAAVGPYSADILAKDLASDRYVVIENQFGKTDHDHLGKLITYGAFLNASAVIWLSEFFTEEHKKALDWLNDNTTDELEFYAVTIELWQIESSKPALKFNVISRPNSIVKQVQAIKSSGELSQAREMQLEFWTQFRDRLLARKVVYSAQSPRAQYWFDVPIGRSNFVLSNVCNTYEHKIGVRLYFRKQVADTALAQLTPQRQEIELILGPLQWNPNPERLEKTIGIYKQVDLNNKDEWPEYVDWMVDTVAKFLEVFGSRIKNLQLNSDEKLSTQATDECTPAL